MRCRWWCEHAWDPFCAHLPIFQLFRESSTNGTLRNLRKQNAEIIESDPILMQDLFNLRDCLVGNYRSPASFIILNFHATSCKVPNALTDFLKSMHDCPYTSVNWRWISIALTPFAFKNRITVRTSHLAGAASGSFLTNGCRAKTERPSGLSDGMFGSGEPRNTAVWSTVTRTVSLQPQHYGDLTFGITLVVGLES